MINYKLVIGTANWCNDYFGTNVSSQEIDKIIAYAKSVGIREFDTARTYANGMAEEILGGIDGIGVYTKGNSIEDYQSSRQLLGDKMIGWLVHHATLNHPAYKAMKNFITCSFGISAYSLREVEMFKKAVGIDFCQLPASAGFTFETPVIIRSIFGKRKALETRTVKEILIEYGKYAHNWDRLVIGVDNVDQLKEIVDIWGEL